MCGCASRRRLWVQGTMTLELRTRSSVEKEKWRFKKNLIMWTFGLLVLGVTILILMFLGPIRK